MRYLDSVEAQIRNAIERGDFDNLANRGKPLDLSDWRKTPEHMRMSYSILKNAGYKPREVHTKSELAELRAPIIVTQSQSDRAVSAQALRDLAEAEGLSVSMVPEAELAIESAREWAGAAPGRGVVVTGSLTLVGQAKTLAEQEGWMRP